MSEAQRQAVELAQHYFQLIAKNAGVTWDDDNATEVEMMVSFIIDAAAEKLRPQLDDAIKRIRELEQQTPQARQLQCEADQAAADLAESGYDRHGRGCGCSYCATDDEAYLDAAEEARDRADDGEDYNGWLP
jgi:ketosteroid isomerase-like protein